MVWGLDAGWLHGRLLSGMLCGAWVGACEVRTCTPLGVGSHSCRPKQAGATAQAALLTCMLPAATWGPPPHCRRCGASWRAPRPMPQWRACWAGPSATCPTPSCCSSCRVRGSPVEQREPVTRMGYHGWLVAVHHVPAAGSWFAVPWGVSGEAGLEHCCCATSALHNKSLQRRPSLSCSLAWRQAAPGWQSCGLHTGCGCHPPARQAPSGGGPLSTPPSPPHIPTLLYSTLPLSAPPLPSADAVPAFNIFGLQHLFSDLGGLSRCAASMGVPGLADTLQEPLLFCELMVFGRCAWAGVFGGRGWC